MPFGHRTGEDRRRPWPQGHGPGRSPPSLIPHPARWPPVGISGSVGRVAGTGVVVVAGQLVASGSGARRDRLPPWRRTPTHATALRRLRRPPRFAGDHGRRPGGRGDDLAEILEDSASLESRLDLHCMTGAGERRVRLAGTPYTDTTHATDAVAPGDDRPWLEPEWSGWTIPDKPPRFVGPAALSSAPPLSVGTRHCPGRVGALLRLEFVVHGLGHVFRSPRQHAACNRPTTHHGSHASRHRRRSALRCSPSSPSWWP